MVTQGIPSDRIVALLPTNRLALARHILQQPRTYLSLNSPSMDISSSKSFANTYFQLAGWLKLKTYYNRGIIFNQGARDRLRYPILGKVGARPSTAP